jgi:hypothetical protein
MPTQVQFRRGTTAQNNSFTGAAGEVSIDTDKDALRIHDGTTSGGFEQAKVDLTNVSGATNLSLSGITTTNSLSIGSTQVISSARQLQNIVSLDATTTATIESAVSAAPNDFTSLNISGLSTFSGITTHTTSLFGTQASFSGVVTATTFVGSLTGTATSTTNIPNLTGDITSVNKATTLATVNSNVGTFGSGGSIPTITVNAKGLVTGVTTTAVNPANDGTLTLAVSGTGLSGSASFTANQSSASTFTVTSNATNANTVSTIVARDGSGNFSAGTIIASLTGTASSTTNIPNLTGDITSINSVTSIAAGVIVNADINASAAIAVSKLAASTISGVTLGNNLNALTISTGLSGSSYNGSGAVTIAIDSTVATLTGTQTLTNKTLTSPTLTTPALGTPSSGTLTSCTGLPLTTGITGTLPVANGGTGVTSSTGTGSVVLSASPSFTGTVGAAAITATGDIAAANFNSTSDISLKDNIQTIVNPLDKIIKLNGVTFNWKENQKPSIGVIAQELEKVLPELVTQGDVKSVNYNGIIGVLIEAVKEQQKQIEELKAI